MARIELIRFEMSFFFREVTYFSKWSISKWPIIEVIDFKVTLNRGDQFSKFHFDRLRSELFFEVTNLSKNESEPMKNMFNQKAFLDDFYKKYLNPLQH